MKENISASSSVISVKYRFVKSFLYAMSKLLFSVEVRGAENIPENSGFILASNHISRLDGFLLTSVKELPEMNFMAMAELFDNPAIKPWMYAINAFPVVRGKGKSKPAVEKAISLLNSKKNFALMPEGAINRTSDPTPQKPHSGVAVIANSSNADILPVCIYIHKKLAFRCKIIISFCNPIRNEELSIIDDDYGSFKLASEQIMQEIRSEYKNLFSEMNVYE